MHTEQATSGADELSNGNVAVILGDLLVVVLIAGNTS